MLFDLFGPFNEGNAFSVEIFPEAYLFHLVRVVYAVYVKVVQREPSVVIYLEYGKRGAHNRFRYAQGFCKTLCKYGLTYTEVTE